MAKRQWKVLEHNIIILLTFNGHDELDFKPDFFELKKSVSAYSLLVGTNFRFVRNGFFVSFTCSL